ncbi:MAG: membrane protein insertase YidC [Chloroflexi bacterium]|nr:membrane protein insertase YidC [Chloroflexota bacterium]
MWDTFILNPMINALLMLYDFLGNNFVLAIAVFTILIRLLTLPLNLRQQRSSMKMQEMQPQIQAIQKKFKDNPQKMQEEFQKIGYNPAESLAGCLPLLIQMPILIGLYRSIIIVLGSTPQSLFELTARVYDYINLTDLLPISNKFLWLSLAQPDPLFILPILVFGTMFLQQKLMTPAAQKQQGKGKKQQDDNPAAAMTQSMQWTMPIMFGFFSLQFQAGLSIYFVLSNIIGIGQGYYMRRSMAELKAEQAVKKPAAVKTKSATAVAPPPAKPAKPAKQDKADLETAMKGTSEERKQYQPRKRTTSKRKRRRR